jgi:hypothetical protein
VNWDGDGGVDEILVGGVPDGLVCSVDDRIKSYVVGVVGDAGVAF